MVQNKRRQILKTSSGLVLFSKLSAIGFLLPRPSFGSAWKKTWFSTVNLVETMKVMGVDDVTLSKNVNVLAPDTAENGAYVGVGVNTTISNVEMVAILVEKNPNMLSGYFEFNSRVVPDVATKIKMAESSNVIALVKTAANNYFMAKRAVNVTLGGCGS